MSLAITFDTLKFANRLKAAGVKPEIAKAHAFAEAEAFAELATTHLATKTDIAELRTETQKEINGLKIDVRQVKADMKQLKNELVIKLGCIMAGGVGIIATLITVFHT